MLLSFIALIELVVPNVILIAIRIKRVTCTYYGISTLNY